MSEPWHVTLFGSLRVQRAEQVIIRFRCQKAASLLAYLAYHHRQAHAREVLIDLLWPESEPEPGRASLSTALSSLRHQLEPPGTQSNTVLRADRYSVSLDAAPVTTDVQAFEEAIGRAALPASPIARNQHRTRAVELYQERLLPGFYEEWEAPEQERLAGLFFDAASRLIGLLEANGDVASAQTYDQSLSGHGSLS